MSARSIRRSHDRRLRRARLATGAALGGSALLASGAQAANFPVTNLNNAGANSLRAAITSANGAAGADTISFSGAGASGEIVLLTEIPITDDLTINGPGAGGPGGQRRLEQQQRPRLRDERRRPWRHAHLPRQRPLDPALRCRT